MDDLSRGAGIAEAARLLGLTPGAVRKRVQRGTLPSFKSETGEWYVVVDDALARIATERNASASVALRPAEPELTSERFAALVVSIQAPLLDRLDAATSRAVRAEAELDELRRLTSPNGLGRMDVRATGGEDLRGWRWRRRAR